MLGNKESADMGRLFEQLSRIPSSQLLIEHDSSIPVAWTISLVDVDENNSEPPYNSHILAATGTTYQEALAKLSKLVYEESLKTKG